MLFQTIYKPIKSYLPGWISGPIKRVATAFITPLFFSIRNGHFRSSITASVVSRYGRPLPWYTYSSIYFLKDKIYTDKSVLEFGGGQSTLWWAKRARRVVTVEGDREWYEKIKRTMPSNVDLKHVTTKDAASCIAEIEQFLSDLAVSEYDIIVIDGLYRGQLIDVACRLVSESGMIICDNTEGEGYHFQEGFADKEFNRVDFIDHAPSTIMLHSTSIFFKANSFAFSPKNPVPTLELDEKS